MAVKILPFNRHIWVEKTAEKEDESAVLLPDGYKGNRGPEFAVVKVMKKSEGVEDISPGDLLVVRNHMIESVEVAGETFHMVLLNHVVGKLLGS